MLDRRSLLAFTAAGLAAGASSRTAWAQDGGVTALLDEVMQGSLRPSPQLMTITGLDVGANAAARGRLDDRSPAGLAVQRRLFQDLKTGLARYDPARLSPSDWINHQTGAYLAATTLQSFDFPYGDPNPGVAVPYIVSQLSGAYRSIPAFLADQHPVETAADAEAYLSRLSAFAVLLDQETARARADFAQGAVPPDFVLRTTLVQFAELTRPVPGENGLVASLAARARAKGLAGDWQARATRIVEAEVYPALARQSDLLQSALASAPSA